VPPKDRGLLARLDGLVALAADRHGLALLPDGRLAAAEARVAARAAGLAGSTSGRGRTAVERDAVELLRCVAEAVGLLRVRGDRLEATSLRNAWSQIDEGLRAGLVYAAWCQQVTLTGLPALAVDSSPVPHALRVPLTRRTSVLARSTARAEAQPWVTPVDGPAAPAVHVRFSRQGPTTCRWSKSRYAGDARLNRTSRHPGAA
jgi:hypothetical protein